ncbi:hypothetical protein ZTR_07464 [Talaromyces verruculosus]|nr:hypothetical protein ZTR_07464 [Talaromyces verruculosus]
MASFLGLPSKLRNIIYKELLMLEGPIDPLFGDQKLLLDSAILYTNRSIYRESSWILYAQNCFDFAGSDFALISRFLDQIGRTNAGYIQDIRISFPRIRDTEDGTFEEDSALLMAKIETDCINMRTIIMGPEATVDMGVYLDALYSPEIITRTLSLINTRLLRFPRLQRIIIEVYDDGPSSDIRTEMDRLGWVFRTVELIEDFDYDRHFSDFDEDDYLDEDLSGDDYSYDVDDDSDFWRRAAD